MTCPGCGLRLWSFEEARGCCRKCSRRKDLAPKRERAAAVSPEERQAMLRRLLPATAAELADLHPGVWPRVLNGTGRAGGRQKSSPRALLRDLRAIGAVMGAGRVWAMPAPVVVERKATIRQRAASGWASGRVAEREVSVPLAAVAVQHTARAGAGWLFGRAA